MGFIIWDLHKSSRIANNLGGSHPAGVFDVVHKYDKAVEFLLDYKIGGIPLPYYILLKSYHDILVFDYSEIGKL